MTRVIDADGHVAEPSVVWTEYTEPAFRDRVIQIRPSVDGPDDLWIDGVNLTSGALNVAATCIPGGLADAELAKRARWHDVPRSAFDPQARQLRSCCAVDSTCAPVSQRPTARGKEVTPGKPL